MEFLPFCVVFLCDLRQLESQEMSSALSLMRTTIWNSGGKGYVADSERPDTKNCPADLIPWVR